MVRKYSKPSKENFCERRIADVSYLCQKVNIVTVADFNLLLSK
jgi:hypothetical protein